MTSWELRRTRPFDKSLSKLDPHIREVIIRQLENIIRQEDPRSTGTALVGSLAGYWRYRSGDYRIIVDIVENEFIVIAVRVGHRSRIYRQ